MVDQDVDELDSFLRGEISAVETCDQELEELPPDARAFVEHRLLPEQLKTHDAISSLKRSRP